MSPENSSYSLQSQAMAEIFLNDGRIALGCCVIVAPNICIMPATDILLGVYSVEDICDICIVAGKQKIDDSTMRYRVRRWALQNGGYVPANKRVKLLAIQTIINFNASNTSIAEIDYSTDCTHLFLLTFVTWNKTGSTSFELVERDGIKVRKVFPGFDPKTQLCASYRQCPVNDNLMGTFYLVSPEKHLLGFSVYSLKGHRPLESIKLVSSFLCYRGWLNLQILIFEKIQPKNRFCNFPAIYWKRV